MHGFEVRGRKRCLDIRFTTFVRPHHTQRPTHCLNLLEHTHTHTETHIHTDIDTHPETLTLPQLTRLEHFTLNT